MSTRLATAALILMVTICLFPEPARAEVAGSEATEQLQHAAEAA